MGALGLPDLLDDRAIFRTEHLAPGTYRASYRLCATTWAYSTRCRLLQRKYFEVWASTTIDVLEIRPHDQATVQNCSVYGKNSGMMDLSQLDGSRSRR